MAKELKETIIEHLNYVDGVDNILGKFYYLSDPDQLRQAVEHCFHLHASCVLPLLESCPQGMLHGDFNDENILVDGTNIEVVTVE